jgi:uncharacterized repeat protein (TIGR01451 family)
MYSSRTDRHHHTIAPTPRLAAAALICVMLAVPAFAIAKANLVLYPSTDDPRSGGHVLGPGAFTLVVENTGTGNGDNTAYETTLIVAVNDPSLLTNATLGLPAGPVDLVNGASFATGIPTMACDGSPIPPHGVYPTAYVSYWLGDIAAGASVEIQVEIEGLAGFSVHFDATARGSKQAGRSVKCYDVVNPSGHDVTVTLAADAEPVDDCPRLEIRKTAQRSGVLIQEDLEYTIEVANAGSCDVSDVVVTENIPQVDDGDAGTTAAFSAVVDPPYETKTGEAWTWPVIPVMTPGETATFTVMATFDQPLADGQDVENTACVTSSEQMEPVCSSFEVAVGEEDGESLAGSAGFWCNRIRLVTEDKGNPGYTLEELAALLEAVDESSTVFSDIFDATTVGQAQLLLCGSHGSDAAAKLVRQLLALWLNVADERVDPALTLDGLCPGDEQLPADVDPSLSVAAVIEAAEAALTLPADRATLLLWKDVIDFINNAILAAGDGCREAEVHRVQVRHSRQISRRP